MIARPARALTLRGEMGGVDIVRWRCCASLATPICEASVGDGIDGTDLARAEPPL
jgi:hypothetical protein